MPTLVGIDIGGTTVKLALVRTGSPHQIITTAKVDTGAQNPGERIVAGIATAVRKMIADTGEKPVGVGVGCPGLINNRTGIVVTSANLPTLKIPLAGELTRQLNLPTAIHNDAKAACLGEFQFGANKGCQNMVLLTLGTGVGGGVITGGRLLTGMDNAATELGHVKVDYTDAAPLCGCGSHGCLETFVGIKGFGRIATAAVAANPSTTLKADKLSTKDLSEAARGGEETAKAIFVTVGQYLGRGIANFIEIFNPEKVVLAGGASRATDLLMPGIRQSLERYCSFHFTRERTNVVATSLPDDINVLGAAAVYLNTQS